MANSSVSILRSLIDTKPAAEDVQPKENTMAETTPVADKPAETPTPRVPFVPELALKASPGHAGHLKILVENAPIAMAMFDSQMRYLLANRRWLDDFKLQNIEIIGRSQYEIFPSLHPGWRHVYERSLQGQVVRSDRDAVTRDGQRIVYRWEVRPWRNTDTSVGGVMITCERLNGTTTALPTQTEQAATSVASKSDAVWDSAFPILALDKDGRVLRHSLGAHEFFKVSAEEVTYFWNGYGEKSRDSELAKQALSMISTAFDNASSQSLLSLSVEAIKNNSKAPAHWQLSVIKGDEWAPLGQAIMAIGVFTPPATISATPTFAVAPELTMSPQSAHPVIHSDLEVQQLADELAELKLNYKQAFENEAIARQRESRLRCVLDVLPSGLLVLDERGRPLYHNAATVKMLGRPLKEGQSVEEWLALCCRDEQHTAEVIRQWREGVWRKQAARTVTLASADGLLKDIEFIPAPLNAGGFVVSMRDVTEYRRAEEMLRSTEAKFRTLVHEAPMPVLLADRAGAIFDANPEAEALLGFTRAELRRLPIERWLRDEALASRAEALREMVRCGDRSVNIAVTLVNRDDQKIPVKMRIASVPDALGAAQFTVHYIERSRAAEPTVVASKPSGAISVAQATGEKTLALLLSTDSQGRVQSWSDDALALFGFSHEEALGRGLHRFFRPSDATGFHNALVSGLAAGVPVEWPFYHKSEGRKEHAFTLRSNAEDNQGVDLYMEVTHPEMEDFLMAEPVVSEVETKAAEEPELVKPTPLDLKRERLLIGETHHRVKNHLQIITSMLNLQISTLNNDEARDALRSSQNRVRSIAALHHHLYQLALGEAADFAHFAGGLIQHLRECYGVSDDLVKMDLQLADAQVPEEWLMPLALSLNEMVSNAFKHAFPENRSGTIRVELTWGDKRGVLAVKDDGVGLPEGFDDRNETGLGMKIIRVFAGQLGGDVLVKSSPGEGAVFQLDFPLVSSDI